MSNNKRNIFSEKLFRCECIENKEMIEKEWNKCKLSGAILIDVRSIQEFKEGHINGAISIPYYELYKRAKEELRNKNQEIMLYCNTGSRSKRAKVILEKLGYNNVKNFYTL